MPTKLTFTNSCVAVYSHTNFLITDHWCVHVWLTRTISW